VLGASTPRMGETCVAAGSSAVGIRAEWDWARVSSRREFSRCDRCLVYGSARPAAVPSWTEGVAVPEVLDGDHFGRVLSITP
jgi:hypothetical protein